MKTVLKAKAQTNKEVHNMGLIATLGIKYDFDAFRKELEDTLNPSFGVAADRLVALLVSTEDAPGFRRLRTQPPKVLRFPGWYTTLQYQWYRMLRLVYEPVKERDTSIGPQVVQAFGQYAYVQLPNGIVDAYRWELDESGRMGLKHVFDGDVPLRGAYFRTGWLARAQELAQHEVSNDCQESMEHAIQYTQWQFRLFASCLPGRIKLDELAAQVEAALNVDPDTLRLASRLFEPFGFRGTVTVKNYNLVIRRRAELETVAAEAPTLLPLYGLCCEDLSFPATGEPVQRLKAYLRGRGLSFSAWRKLLLMAPGALHFVREFYYGSPREAVIDHLKVCDALGLQGHRPRWLLAKIYSVCGNSTHRRTSYLKRIEEGHFLENASHVVRLYLANALPVNPLDSGIVDDLMDWFARPNAAVLTRAQRQGLWPLLAGRASKWREACMVAESKNLSSWRPPFDRLNLEGLELVALADSGALSQESRALHNCINAPGYVKKCSSGSYCLASLRLNGKSIATAAYVKDDDNKWRLSIALGPCNQTLAGSIDSQLRQAGLHIGTSTTAN